MRSLRCSGLTKPSLSLLRRRTMSLSVRCGQELRIGSLGVPLAVAPDIWRRVFVNREPARKVWESLELSPEVGKKMVALLRRHRLPSRDRLIVLSLGYPDRTHADIARAFRVTVDQVADCERRSSDIRRAEPLSTELWEDINAKEMGPAEIARRAARVRQINIERMVQGEVPGSPGQSPPGRGQVGGPDEDDPRSRCRKRGQARPPGPQSKSGLLSNPGRSGGGGHRNKAPQP